MKNNNQKTIGEMITDCANMITAVEITIREIHNLPWVSMKQEDGIVWWENLNHKSQVNPRTRLSPQLILRDVECMSITDLTIKIIGIFDDIDNWKEPVNEYYAVDDMVKAYDELSRWISETGDRAGDHIAFYEPVACAGDIEMTLKPDMKLITGMDIIIRKSDKYSICDKRNVVYYGMDKLVVLN